MAVNNDGAWSEVALIGVTKAGESEIQYASLIEEFEPSEGDKDNTFVAMANGGRIMKRTPEGDVEITMKLYEIDIETSQSLAQYWNGTSDATAPLESVNSRIRDRFRVAFLWTDDSAATTAGGTTASGNYARRLVFEECRMTAYKEAWEDKTLTINVTFKAGAFRQDGSGTVTRQSVQSGDGVGLSALASYS